jgi:hypothetical protein
VIPGTLRSARRKRFNRALNRALTIGVTVVLAAGLAIVWVRVVQTLTAPPNPPRAVGEPGGLVWDERVFTTPSQLKAYLNSKGLSYSRWVARHPTAFGTPAPVSARHPTSTTKTVKSKPKPTSHHRVAAPAVTDTRSRPLTSLVLTILLLVGGVILGGSAMLPPRYAPVAVQRLYADPDRRMVALAAATAILFGFGVSFYLT